MPAGRRIRAITALLVVWMLALAALWLLRARAHTPWYTNIHAWLDRQGVPPAVRNLDATVLLLIALAVAWMTVRQIAPRPRGSMPADLALSGGPGWLTKGIATGAIMGAPMLVFGLALAVIRGASPSPSWFWLQGVVAAPIGEELFFRGLLVFTLWRTLARGFWPLAIAASLAFGLAHVQWTAADIAAGWGTILVTAAGGVWFAWLARAWAARQGSLLGNIWVPIALHAVMNLSWSIMASDSGAVGGLWPNVARGLTIAFGTVWTIRRAGPRSRA